MCHSHTWKTLVPGVPFTSYHQAHPSHLTGLTETLRYKNPVPSCWPSLQLECRLTVYYLENKDLDLNEDLSPRLTHGKWLVESPGRHTPVGGRAR